MRIFLFLCSIHILFGEILDYPYLASAIDDDEEEWNPDLSLLDLEEKVDDFILEIKKIEIPDYPTSFNPSIVRWGDRYLLSFRIRLSNGSTNQMGLIWLNQDFECISEPKILQVRGTTSFYPSKQQDPRLVWIGEKLYIEYANSIEGIDRDIRRVYIAELQRDGEEFYIESPECLTHFPGATEKWEKNWPAFDYKGNLLLAYSIFPHNIFRPILGTGSCESIASTFGNIKWQWGVLRGGTPALLLNDSEYLAFFHSSILLATTHSNGKKIQHYFMGAYTFSSEPPFSLSKISPKPIVGKGFYRGPAYKTWKPLRVVFPCGYVMDDRFIWIVYGRQDFEIWVAKFDKQGLLNSLIDCKKEN